MGGTEWRILTREPEIIIVTYIYAPWAPRHVCCDVYTSRGIQRAKNYRNHNKDELILRKENIPLDIKATLTPALGYV